MRRLRSQPFTIFALTFFSLNDPVAFLLWFSNFSEITQSIKHLNPP
jgi:hypothetical protein